MNLGLLIFIRKYIFALLNLIMCRENTLCVAYFFAGLLYRYLGIYILYLHIYDKYIQFHEYKLSILHVCDTIRSVRLDVALIALFDCVAQ